MNKAPTMSWSSGRYGADSAHRMDVYGSSERSRTFGSVWDQAASRPMDGQRLRMSDADRMRMLEMERARMLERERVRREENARQEKEKAVMYEQQRAIMLEREKLKRMEEEAERTRLKSMQSSAMPSRSFGEDRPFSRDYQMPARGNDMWDSRRPSPPREWNQNSRGREMDFEMRRERLPEKRGRLDNSYGFSMENNFPKRSRMQEDSSPWQRNERMDSFDRGGRRMTGNNAFRSPPNKYNNQAPRSSLGLSARGRPTERTPVWQNSQGSGLSMQLLRNLQEEAEQLIHNEERRPQPQKPREVRRSFPTNQQGFKKPVQVKRLDNAYNKKFQAGKFQKKGGTVSGASKPKPTPVKKVEIKKPPRPEAPKQTKPYYCNYCKVQYKKRETYRLHLREKEHVAQVAKREDEVVNYLLYVIQASFKENQQSKAPKKMCTTCCHEFPASYTKHCKTEIHKLKSHNLGVTCDLCSQIFRRRTVMDRHLASLQHARNLACKLRKEGKYVEVEEDLTCPEKFDGKSMAIGLVQDIKAVHCVVCNFSGPLKDNDITAHCKTKEHYDNMKAFAEKAKAEEEAKKKAKLEAQEKAKEESKKAVKAPAKKAQATGAKKGPAAKAPATNKPVAPKIDEAVSKQIENTLIKELEPAKPQAVKETEDVEMEATEQEAETTEQEAETTEQEAETTEQEAETTEQEAETTEQEAETTEQEAETTEQKAETTEEAAEPEEKEEKPQKKVRATRRRATPRK